MTDDGYEEELEKIEEELKNEVLDEEKDEMKVDNRSVFTLKDQIVKKAKDNKDETN